MTDFSKLADDFRDRRAADRNVAAEYVARLPPATTEPEPGKSHGPDRLILVLSGMVFAALALIMTGVWLVDRNRGAPAAAPKTVAALYQEQLQQEQERHERARKTGKPASDSGAQGAPGNPAGAGASDSDSESITTGDLAGVITYDGTPPPAGIIAPGIPDESLIVDPKTMGIANVIVYLPRRPSGARVPPPPAAPVAFNAAGGVFTPHVLFVQTGQLVTIANANPFACSMRSHAVKNSAFNFVLPPAGIRTITYSAPERTPVSIGSASHLWMTARHLVLDHPWGAVTDATGAFTIKDLPVGTHKFTIWHERAGYLIRDTLIEIKPGETAEFNVAVPEAKFNP